MHPSINDCLLLWRSLGPRSRVTLPLVRPCKRALRNSKLNVTVPTPACYELSWIYPGRSIQQNNNCTANYHPSQKSSENLAPDLQYIAGGANKNLSAIPCSGRPTCTYIGQLCDDTGCLPEDLISDRDAWRDWVKDIRASTTWWWWW